MNISRRLRPIVVTAAVILVLAAAGCESGNRSNPKQEAKHEWNAARASVLASLAKDQYQAGNFDKCRQTVDDALRLTPESAPLRLLSAKLLIESGKLESAERELNLAREQAPKNGEADYLMGIIEQRWQKPGAAFDCYQVAARKSPAEPAYVMAESEMLVAMNQLPRALAMLQDKVDYFEHSATIRDACGQILMQLGRVEEAVGMFRQASILAEEDDGIRERLAMAEYAHKEYRDAAETLDKLLKNPALAKRADLMVTLGQCHLENNRPRDARTSFETATRTDPSSAMAWRGLARAAMALGDNKRAEISLTRSLKLDATQSEVYLLRGYLHLREQRLADALESFEHATALAPNDPVGLCMVGLAYQKMGQPRNAEQYFAKAIQIKPDDELANQLLAGVDPKE